MHPYKDNLSEWLVPIVKASWSCRELALSHAVSSRRYVRLIGSRRLTFHESLLPRTPTDGK